MTTKEEMIAVLKCWAKGWAKEYAEKANIGGEGSDYMQGKADAYEHMAAALETLFRQ